MEEAFRRFGGVPEEVLFDNARALMVARQSGRGEVLPH
jgi:transposase